MSVIYMVRHGQASFGKPNYDELSEKGAVQARILAEHFLRAHVSFDAVYAGQLVRQRDTARQLISVYRLKGERIPELCEVPEFNEYDARSVFMTYTNELIEEDPAMGEDLPNIYTDTKAFERVYEKVVRRWISGDHSRPGVTSWGEFQERVESGLQRIRQENGRRKRIIVFTSGGTLSAAVSAILELSAEHAMRIAAVIPNTSITAFLYNDERISLASFNTYSHLVLHNGGNLVTYR
jgi:broad specificity phosphatase PhoE